MKRKMIKGITVITALFFSALFWGCGGGPGSPGSTNSEGTGLMVTADISFAGNPSPDTQSSDVDAFQEICDPGPPPKAEPFRDHPAVVTFTATPLNPKTSSTFQPGTLFIEQYTVDFRAKNDSIGAPPIESYTGSQEITIFAPAAGVLDTSVVASVMLVDLRRKNKYASDMTTTPPSYTSSPSFINNYTATFTFEGQNQYGSHFTVISQADFSIGDFNNCP